MEITLKITEKDYLHYAFMHMRKWRSRAYHIILFSITALLGLVALFMPADPTMGFTRIIGIVLLALTTFFILVLGISYIRLKSEYASNSILHQPISYGFTTEGISATTAVSQALIEWSLVVKVKESHQMVAIYISNSQAYILPKNQLSSAQLKEFFSILYTHLSESKLRRKQIV
jgi:hypothetical protein